jgi:sugar diacid utilization regulator
MAVRDGEGRGYRVYHHPPEGRCGNLVLSLAEILSPKRAGGDNPTDPVALEEALLVQEEPQLLESNLLIPLRAAGTLVGIVALPGLRPGEVAEDRYPHLIMVCCCGALALEVALMSEQAEQRLQEKVAEMHVANLVLREQQRAWQSYLEVHHRLSQLVLNNEGIAAIGQGIHETVGRPIFVEDELGQGLIQIGWPADQPPHKVGGVVERGAAGLMPLQQPRYFGRHEGQHEMVIPLVAGKELLGHLHVLLEGRLGSLEHMLLQNAAMALSLELVKQRTAREAELRLRMDFLRRLLRGGEMPPTHLEAEASRLGLRFEPGYRVLLIRPIGEKAGTTEACGALAKALNSVRDRFQELEYEGFVVDGGKDSLLVVLGTEKDETEGRKRMGAVGAELLALLNGQGINARGGISGPGGKASDLPRLLKEASKALEMSAAGMGQVPVAWYQDLGVFAWVELDPEGLKQATRRLLGPVLEYERTHNLNLLDTLSLYYRHNCNLRKTAAAGYMSLSTVRYRLQRIRQLSGLDLEDPDTRLQVQLALKFLAQ